MEDMHEGVHDAIKQINKLITDLFKNRKEGLKENEFRALKVSFCQTIATFVTGLAFQEFDNQLFGNTFKELFIKDLYNGAEEFNGNFDN